ncbi:hypothetical protein, partial [Streptomyces albospinus]|uniref:hypothetical protein n=1 Tax=Streptomyces albospinus TaxID=285515 RepID=UPI001E60BCC1
RPEAAFLRALGRRSAVARLYASAGVLWRAALAGLADLSRVQVSLHYDDRSTAPSGEERVGSAIP